MYDGVYSIAAPIFNLAGLIKAGLAISAPTARGQANEAAFIKMVLATSEAISRRLGYNGDYPPASPNQLLAYPLQAGKLAAN